MDHREDKGLLLGPSAPMCRFFLKHCTLTSKAVGTTKYMTGIGQTSAEATRSRALSRLIASWESYSSCTFPRLHSFSVFVIRLRHISSLFLLSLLRIRGSFSIFCPLGFKARSTTLIFVEYTCITFHQTSLLDDVNKGLAVFTGQKLCFWYVCECTPHILKYGRSGLTLTLKLPI